MKTEQEVKKLLEEKISDLDKIIAKLEDDSVDVNVEMFDVAEQLEGEIDVLKEVLEIKER